MGGVSPTFTINITGELEVRPEGAIAALSQYLLLRIFDDRTID